MFTCGCTSTCVPMCGNVVCLLYSSAYNIFEPVCVCAFMCAHAHWCVNVLCSVGVGGIGSHSTPQKAWPLLSFRLTHYKLTGLIRHCMPCSTVAFSNIVIHTSTLTHNPTVKPGPTHGEQWGQGQHTSANNHITHRDTSHILTSLSCCIFSSFFRLGIWMVTPKCPVGPR